MSYEDDQQELADSMDEIRRLRKALSDIANGARGKAVPLEPSAADFTNAMWKWSQKTARDALKE